MKKLFLFTLYRAKSDGHTVGLLNMAGLIATPTIQKTKFDLKNISHI
jgi:hypothetical protein